MRTLFIITLVPLLYFMHVYSDVHSAEDVLHEVCCSRVSNTSFRQGYVAHVARTRRCLDAIIVKHVCGKTFCVSANLTSAQDLLQRFTTAMGNRTKKSPFGKECRNPRCRKGYGCRS